MVGSISKLSRRILPRKPLYSNYKSPKKGWRASYAEDLIRLKILPNGLYFQIGAGVGDQYRVEILLFLIQNVDVFAWSLYEVPGVDPEFIIHKLNVDPSFPPKK